MKFTEPSSNHDSDRHETPKEEKKHRELGLDKTIADSFPASDPPSTDPNPDEEDQIDDVA